MDNTYRGSCLCQKLSFEYDGPSLWCAHCHCTLCRRSHGSAFITWVGVDEKRFRLIGESTLQWFESSPGAKRGFCGRCGSSVFFVADRWPGEIHITRASIAGEIDLSPKLHVFWENHVDWVQVDDRLERKEST